VNAPARTGGGSMPKPAGTWPYVQGNNSSISPGGIMAIPSWAYHNTRRTYALDVAAANAAEDPRSPRFTDGRTNAAFMDGHAASVRVWKGTSNPCMPNDPSCQ
jgi:prepilin-type processing-associated H-X9-DG protein